MGDMTRGVNKTRHHVSERHGVNYIPIMRKCTSKCDDTFFINVFCSLLYNIELGEKIEDL